MSCYAPPQKTISKRQSLLLMATMWSQKEAKWIFNQPPPPIYYWLVKRAPRRLITPVFPTHTHTHTHTHCHGIGTVAFHSSASVWRLLSRGHEVCVVKLVTVYPQLVLERETWVTASETGQREDLGQNLFEVVHI